MGRPPRLKIPTFSRLFCGDSDYQNVSEPATSVKTVNGNQDKNGYILFSPSAPF
jgi:hypothetical protein